MSRPRAADDFATIRARLDELRRERESSDATAADADNEKCARAAQAERYRQARIEGLPPPWVPTIFIKQPPV